MSVPDHWCWRAGPVAPGPAVVVDMDGVVSEASGRQHFLDRPGRGDWEGFFDACGDDPLIPETARLLELLDPGVAVVLLTGRPVRVRPLTLAWLERHELRWDLLVMRARGDYSVSLESKREEVAALRAGGFDLRLALEDDVRNREMLQAEGVPCLYVHSGYYRDFAAPAPGAVGAPGKPR